MIRVLVVDDHPVVLEGLSHLIADEPDFRVVGEAMSGEEALLAAARVHPDVAVVDVRLPGMTGIELCEQMLRRQSDVQVILLTSFPNERVLDAGRHAGARGFVLKESPSATLRQAVRTVAGGGTYTDPKAATKFEALARKGKRGSRPFGLTAQELRVLELLPRGLSNRAIGDELGISDETVKTHLRNLKRKLGAKDRVEAAAIAIREGLS